MYKLSHCKPNKFSSVFNLADLVLWVHLQFANLLEKPKSKKINIFFFINPGKYYVPIWKEETNLLKIHAQLTYKQNEKQYFKHTL